MFKLRIFSDKLFVSKESFSYIFKLLTEFLTNQKRCAKLFTRKSGIYQVTIFLKQRNPGDISILMGAPTWALSGLLFPVVYIAKAKSCPQYVLFSPVICQFWLRTANISNNRPKSSRGYARCIFDKTVENFSIISFSGHLPIQFVSFLN